MKRDGWRMLGTLTVLLVGIGVGMSFPWGRAQDPAIAPEEKAAVGAAGTPKGATEVGKEVPGKDVDPPLPIAKGPTPADVARDRIEIAEEDGRFTLTTYFPNKTDPKRTRWKITCSTERGGTLGGPRETLMIHYAFFQPAPDAPEVQVLGQTYLVESMVAYSDGVRYYDIAHHTNGLLKATTGDLGDRAFTLDKSQKILCEIRDRGLHWKVGGGDHRSRRGEELVLWGTIKAANYLYVIHFGFFDDGTIQAKMGSTGSNLTPHLGPEKSHTHIALWRIDIDFGPRDSNDVYLVKHREPLGRASTSTQIIEPFNGDAKGNARAGFADWNPKEFTVLRIVNPMLVGPHKRPAAYDLISHRTGSARHFGDSPDERFTQHDYYVMPYKEGKDGTPQEVDVTKLPQYVRGGDSLKGKDIVLWHLTSAHHIPRQEDMFGGSTGATCVVWSGFDLKPRDLFSGTPFFASSRPKGRGK